MDNRLYSEAFYKAMELLYGELGDKKINIKYIEV
jgi:hypothetical protein